MAASSTKRVLRIMPTTVNVAMVFVIKIENRTSMTVTVMKISAAWTTLNDIEAVELNICMYRLANPLCTSQAAKVKILKTSKLFMWQ